MSIVLISSCFTKLKHKTIYEIMLSAKMYFLLNFKNPLKISSSTNGTNNTIEKIFEAFKSFTSSSSTKGSFETKYFMPSTKILRAKIIVKTKKSLPNVLLNSVFGTLKNFRKSTFEIILPQY